MLIDGSAHRPIRPRVVCHRERKMAMKPASKEFAVERLVKLRQRERDLARLLSRSQRDGVEVVAAFDASGISNAELLDELRLLRKEIRGLGVGPAAAPARGPMLNENVERDIQLEIALMVRVIARAKAEIASIKHPMSDSNRMEVATSELDEIVRSTESATHQILEANETIEKEIHRIAGTHHHDEEVVLATDKIANQVISIFEACNFQDLTGQRITKVVRTLRFIEERIIAMIDIWGIEAFSNLPLTEDGEAARRDNLMNGPQLGNVGITQADIDALFD